MADILFIAQGPGNAINTLAGSGLGFYGSAGFAASVAVNQFNANTFVTDSTGTQQGPQCHNSKWVSPTGVVLDSAESGILLTQVPNYMCPLNVRFTHSGAVKVQNAKAVIFDRSNVNHAASGVTTYMAEVVHPNPNQVAGGSGDSEWAKFDYTNPGSGLSLSSSPGTSGLSPNGVNTQDARHDWYLLLSASPDSVGSKNLYGLWVYLEYL